MKHSSHGKGYCISASGPRPARFTWHNARQSKYDLANSQQLKFQFLRDRKHHLNYKVTRTTTTPSREDKCFSDNHSLHGVERLPPAIPEDLFTNNPRRQGRPPPHVGQVFWESEPSGKRGTSCLVNICRSRGWAVGQAIWPSILSPRFPVLRVGQTPPLAEGRYQSTGRSPWDNVQRVCGWERYRERTDARPALPFTASSSRDLVEQGGSCPVSSYRGFLLRPLSGTQPSQSL